jgi:hypothetical protein
MTTSVELRRIDGECACDLCGHAMYAGELARGQDESDGSVSWVCEECWQDIGEHYEPCLEWDQDDCVEPYYEACDWAA